MFDHWLIPEFGCAARDEPVILWIPCTEMICDLCKRMDFELILPLHQRLNKEKKGSLQHIKQAFITAYAPNSFNACNPFVAC